MNEHVTVTAKLAWVGSLLATALLSASLVGPGTAAVWSDSVTVRHRITTGHTELKIVELDGVSVTPADDYRLTDRIRGGKVGLIRVLAVRNEGTLALGSLVLSVTPSPNDVPRFADELTLATEVTDEAGTSSQARTLAEWEARPRELDIATTIEPGEAVTVTLRITGVLTGHEQERGVEPVYTFTALER